MTPFSQGNPANFNGEGMQIGAFLHRGCDGSPQS